eukprot:1139334-Pelagomonas_calceolata.AAC.3
MPRPLRCKQLAQGVPTGANMAVTAPFACNQPTRGTFCRLTQCCDTHACKAGKSTLALPVPVGGFRTASAVVLGSWVHDKPLASLKSAVSLLGEWIAAHRCARLTLDARKGTGLEGTGKGGGAWWWMERLG